MENSSSSKTNNTLQIDLNQTVQFILQFLKENNLQSSFQQLIDETGVEYNLIQNKDDLLENVRKGQWHQVLKQLQYLKIQKSLLIGIYEQIIKELIIEKEFDLAIILIKEQNEVLSDKPELLQQLWDLTQIRDPPHTLKSVFKDENVTLDSLRNTLADGLDQYLESEKLPPSRLLKLMSQGLQYENLITQEKGVQNQYRQLINNQDSNQYLSNSMQDENGPLYVQKVISIKAFNGDFQVQTVVISNDCRYLVLGGKDGLIEVWNFTKMQLDLALPYQKNDLFLLHRKAILSLVFSKDDRILASGDAEGIIRIWKFSDGKRLKEIDTQGGENSGISAMAMTSNNSQIIVGCFDKTIRVYGLKSGTITKQFSGNDSFVTQLYLMPGKEQFLISASENGQVYVWNLHEVDPKNQKSKSLQTPVQLHNKDFIFNNISINKVKANEILISYRYNTAFLMNIETNSRIMEYMINTGQNEEIISSQFSEDCESVYIYSSNKTLYIFNKKSGKLISSIIVPIDNIDNVMIKTAISMDKSEEFMVMHSLRNLFKLTSSID